MTPTASTANDVRRSSFGRGRKTRGVYAAAVWAACLAAGVGIGVLTDGGAGPPPRGVDPGAGEDRDRLRSPVDDPAVEPVDPAGRSGGTRVAGEAVGMVRPDPLDAPDAPAGGAASTAPPTAGVRAPVEGIPRDQALAILGAILPPAFVDPSLGGWPPATTSTTGAPTTTATAQAPAPTTTTTGAPDGPGPVITPLPGVGEP